MSSQYGKSSNQQLLAYYLENVQGLRLNDDGDVRIEEYKLQIGSGRLDWKSP